MINLILTVGTTAILASGTVSDLSSFQMRLEESRATAVRAYAQFIKAFNELDKAQKDLLLSQINPKPFATSIEMFPDMIMAINDSVVAAGGKSLTKKEFSEMVENELK